MFPVWKTLNINECNWKWSMYMWFAVKQNLLTGDGSPNGNLTCQQKHYARKETIFKR